MRIVTWMAFIGMALTGGSLWASSPDRGGVVSPRPSVLIITLDTTRADKLGCYGSDAKLTPSLDGWAGQSFVFDNCESAIPQTFPSHTTIFSGWNPNHHGLRKNLEVRLSPSVPLLAEAFRKAGYSTGAFVSAFVLLGRYGLSRGFDTYDNGFYDPRHPEIVERRAQDTLKLARDWLDRRRQPFFCWVHLFDPHVPYEPPPPYATRFKSQPYDGEVAYMDAQLGLFLQHLKTSGLLENAVVVICGDHGESLGEHGEMTHSIFLYQATTRVPLLIHLPGQAQGGHFSQTVGLVDLSSTLRDICSLPPVVSDGASLAPLLAGRPWKPHPIYLESLEGLDCFGWAPLYGLVKGSDKFILAPRRELYDVAKDPGEQDNLFGRRPKTGEPMEVQLREIIGKTKPVSTESLSLDQEEMRSLQSLGYIGGSPGRPGADYKDPKDGIGIVWEFNQAMGYFEAGQLEEAARAFQSLDEKEPNNAQINAYLGLCYEKSDPMKAIACYKQAIRCRPEYLQAYEQLVWVLETQGRMQEAYQVARLTVKAMPDIQGKVNVLLAWAAYELGKPMPEVIAALNESRRLGGSDLALACKLRALLALKSGDRKGALSFLENMATVSPPEGMSMLAADKNFKDIQGDPRFVKLMAQAKKQVDLAKKPVKAGADPP